MVIAFLGLLVNVVVATVISRGGTDLNARAALSTFSAICSARSPRCIAGAVIHFTGWLPVDPILSLAIAVLILVCTQRVLRDALHVLMEGVPPAIELAAIGARAASRYRASRGARPARVEHRPGQVALSAHLEMSDLQSWPRSAGARPPAAARPYGIGHVTLQPEPLHGIRAPYRASRSALSRSNERDRARR